MRIDDIKVGDMIEVLHAGYRKNWKGYRAVVVRMGNFGTFCRICVAPLTQDLKVDHRRKEQYVDLEDIVKNFGAC